ncbi:UPF0259 family protein [Buchnera aphidicola (Macrosiphoniella sanborni)]|uniref:UPF0259 membrane protein D9V74_01290 n=1 Tax=Buchnera aphidicola (Macrosiphoniella sanborni) TaxID=1241865 RepID=A0A4D6YHI7_9GAMM|nr:YciC family protein [Buchnera aphidicola]QCI23815.1 UPF0259 family protein [Buchnera aphidicola (Macrosiphoniella sanborni)]
MQITVSELYHDTCYFFCKQIRIIVFIAVLVTFLNVLMDMFFTPDIHISSIIENNNFISTNSLLDLINNMNLHQKYALFKYSILKIMILLISKTILLGSIIILISNLSKNKRESIISLIYSFFSFAPSLFILNFLNVIMIQLGFVLLIIPGILLSIILPLSPIILFFKKYSLIDSIRISIDLSWKNVKLIGPAVLFWMLSKFFLTILFSHIYILNKNIEFLILNISLNILFSVLIIYLFRFYMISLRFKN